MKIAIKSVKWTFHEIAARQYFPNQQVIDILEKTDIQSLLKDVEDWTADYWVIEIENTITWTIYNHLHYLRNANVSIIWETYLNVDKNLSALPGVSFNDIKYVCWEHTAIEQTRSFFEKYPNITIIECGNLSIAWRNIKEKNLMDAWLIGGRLAAKMYWFNILIDKIESEIKNYTRFVIVKRKAEVSENKDFNMATLHIVIPNQIWSLMKILWVITAYDINLTKIESVPIHWEPFHYSFYIDIGFTYKQSYEGMLAAVRPLAKELDVLWEYKANDKIMSEN